MALRKGFFKEKASGPDCVKCKLGSKCRNPKLPVYGLGKQKALIIGSQPSIMDDKFGKLGNGEATEFLEEELEKFGLDLYDDFWKINAVNCATPKGRKPTRKEINCCRPYIENIIEELKPNVIILLGDQAIESQFNGRFKDLSVTRWRGLCVPEVKNNAWVVPLMHPAHVVKMKWDAHLKRTFRTDLKYALSVLRKKEKPEVLPYQEHVHLLTTMGEIRGLFDYLKKEKPLSAYDWETSAIKPYDSDQLIWSCAIATERGSYAFPIHYPSGSFYPKKGSDFYWDKHLEEVEDLVSWYINDPEMKKIAHGSKFETTWGTTVLGKETRGIECCTMTRQHVLDARKKFCGLKFQLFIRYGIEGYEKGTKKYYPEGHGNTKNELFKMPLKELLTYNGIDAFGTLKLYHDQNDELRIGTKSPKEDLIKCSQLFQDGLEALGEAQMNGIRMDLKLLHSMKDDLTKTIDNLALLLNESREAVEFKKFTGEELNFNSSKHLGTLLFDVMKLEPTKKTSSGSNSVDKEALTAFDSEFTRNLLEYRKFLKIRDTYIAQFVNEIGEDGLLHPFFDLHTARTGRSSSSSPNFQNIPIRTDEGKELRKIIIPRKGHKISENDYGSIEVRIAACYTKDPVLISYINDPTTDMHRDQAQELFLLNSEEVNKTLRFYAKNGWVFPQFYGSYYKNCASGLWENCHNLPVGKNNDGLILTEHLRKKGIKCYDDFVEHCKHHEKAYWDRFTVFKEWQESVKQFYLKYGYTKSFFGFRRSGYLSQNDVINTPIQGTAFHCLLWSFARISKIAKKEKWNSKLIGQIHDSIIIDLDPAEETHVLKTVNKVMTIDIREDNDWIIVPLEVEPELTGVDEPWYYKKAVPLPA